MYVFNSGYALTRLSYIQKLYWFDLHWRLAWVFQRFSHNNSQMLRQKHHLRYLPPFLLSHLLRPPIYVPSSVAEEAWKASSGSLLTGRIRYFFIYSKSVHFPAPASSSCLLVYLQFFFLKDQIYFWLVYSYSSPTKFFLVTFPVTFLLILI